MRDADSPPGKCQESDSSRAFLPVFLVSLKLGLTSFGGPVAHLGYFHREFVARRQWLSESRYADLMALCQFLPGPASSQVNMAIGLLRAGWKGALAAWLGFTLPSALLMIAFAYEMDRLGDISGSGWLKGLKIAAVAVVAQAVWSMGTKFCTRRVTLGIAILGAALLSASWSSLTQLGVIAAGSLTGWLLLRSTPPDPASPAPRSGDVPYGTKGGTAFLVAFLLLFIGLPLVERATGSFAMASFEAFYQAGSLVFGGGHVVLPLLRSAVITPGWIGEDRFLAGYGAAQALPGPLFTFAAFLGTTLKSGWPGWIGGIWCLAALYLPSTLLLFGTLPYWERFRKTSFAPAALQGANAAVVGVLLAALYNPVISSSIHGPVEVILALMAYGLLVFLKLPPWLVVVFCAASGALFLR